MTDADIAHFYNLPSAYPEEWPAELNEDDEEEEQALQRRGSKSGYIVLDRSNSLKSVNIGSIKGSSRENLVKVDEPDPLGSSDSVLGHLKRRGLPVDEDSRLRSRFLLSSTGFSPALFLSQVHSDASIESLLDGLNVLSRSIDQKSASLKVLVEANFERFVRAKATIDSVYTEMRNQGREQELVAHRRSVSHLRSTSNAKQGTSLPTATGDSGFRKNALLKESDYGVKGIRVPLTEASVKAGEVWGPALGGREREQMLKSVVGSMEKHREVYEIGGLLSKSIKQRDYDSVFEQYRTARALTQNAKTIADAATSSNRALTDEETHAILALGRMWIDVDQQIQAFKRDLWRRLSEAPSTATRITTSGPVEEYMELIGALLELGVDDNPIWVWLVSRYDYLKTKITAFCERCKVEIEILRRRLASGAEPTTSEVASFLRRTPQDTNSTSPSPTLLDTDQVIELWECVHTYLNKLLSSQGGILGEVLDFWEVAQSFIDGSKQKLLPAGFEGESRKHHQFSTSDIRDLKKGLVELVNLIRESILSLFADPPVDDVSLLTSPISPPSPSSPITLGVTPTESRFKLDPRNMPFPTPKRGELWEGFSFWPPFSNSLSGVHYLGQFLVIIGAAAGEMATLGPVSSSENNTRELLRALVSVVRERSVRIACSAWGKDAGVCRLLEDWTRDSKRRDLTKMPGLFVNFENAMLGGMQKILYISEAMAKPGTVAVVTQPPTKLLQMVRREFIASIEAALGGLVENAEHPTVRKETDEWSATGYNKTEEVSSLLAADAVESNNKNVRILLTLSNIKAFQADLVPQLVANFETAFSVTLTDEAKTLRQVLDQVDQRLFQSYTKPTIKNLEKIISEGVTSPVWEPTDSRPDQVRPYVYNAMLTLVLVHTEISTTIPSTSSSGASRSSVTGQSPLLSITLTHLLTQVSNALLNAFNLRAAYSLNSLIQATLDTEFIAQTMSQYSSDEASAIQSQIYVELDRRTTHEARARLQSELGEMRGILKRLRERTKGEFACFRKARSGTSQK
ncbi:exocyst complex component Sec5-domain-containing protein [Aspergillus heterothallicus]